jgi:hypothetical protein
MGVDEILFDFVVVERDIDSENEYGGDCANFDEDNKN